MQNLSQILQDVARESQQYARNKEVAEAWLLVDSFDGLSSNSK